MGNLTGRIFFDGYGYGMILPDRYVPVAIPNTNAGDCARANAAGLRATTRHADTGSMKRRHTKVEPPTREMQGVFCPGLVCVSVWDWRRTHQAGNVQ
jgi:hypothetical protein